MIMANIDYLQDIDSCDIPCHIIESPELCKPIFSDKFDFKVLTVNIRSILHNFDGWLLTFARLNIEFDVLILTECWLKEDSILPQIQGYTAFRTYKYINKAGGVVVYVGNIWEPDVREPNFDDANCLHIHLKNHVNLFAIYRSPSFTDTTPFLDSLVANINSIRPSTCTIVAGDININTLSVCGSPHLDSSSEYLCLLAELDLIPTINKPTRGKSCLDHVHVTSKHHAIGVVCRSDVTDHHMAMTGVSINRQKTGYKKRLVTKLDYDEIVRELSCTDWTGVLNKTSVDDAVSAFADIISGVTNRNTSRISVSRSKFVLKPWMTPGLIRCSKHRDYLHAKVRNNPNDKILSLIYTRYKNYHNQLIRKLRRQHESMVLEQNKDNPKKLWDSIRTLTHTKRQNHTAIELTKTKKSTIESLNHCNEFFTNVGKCLADKILTISQETQESLAAKVKLKVSPLDSFFMLPTDEAEIESIINGMKLDGAPGRDGISNRFLKINKNNLLVPLTYICNLSLTEGTFPSEWKSATVIPIFKAGNRGEPSNYRPISLLSCFSKILEKLVNKRLVDYLEEKKLISDRQYGFRRGRSTQDAVSLLTGLISDHLDNKRVCIGVFLDLAKAFDTVSIPILIRKLESVGVRGVTLDWFQSYLTNRSQSTKVVDQLSNSMPIEFGVPQGSVLAPTLFTVYINDIMDSVSDHSDVICYADDTAIIFNGSSWSDVYGLVECGMSGMAAWLRNNLLTLNLTKTQFICFHKTCASAPPSSPEIPVHFCKLNGRASCKCQNISRASNLKYLGVVIDERLSFGDHLVATAKRVRKLIYLFRILRQSADLKLLGITYKALCESVVGYCITVWGGAGKDNMMIVERAQRAVLKVMLKRPIKYPSVALYKESGVLTVRGLFLLGVTILVHRAVIASANYTKLIERRLFRLQLPAIKTTFARRFSRFLHPYVYNKVNSMCCIKLCSISETKRKVNELLASLSYHQLEDILREVR